VDFTQCLGDWYSSITAAKVISLLSVVIIAVACLLLTRAAGRSSQLWNGCAAIMNSVFMGYVVMPEHVHLLLSEPQCGALADALKSLKQGVSRRLIRSSHSSQNRA
jgi:hypothetical protein